MDFFLIVCHHKNILEAYYTTEQCLFLSIKNSSLVCPLKFSLFLCNQVSLFYFKNI